MAGTAAQLEHGHSWPEMPAKNVDSARPAQLAGRTFPIPNLARSMLSQELAMSNLFRKPLLHYTLFR